MARAPAVAEIEPRPEADRQDELPHPRHTRTLYGHAEAETMLAGAIASGRMHHGWLLAGPKGVGKATLAYRVARAALAEPSQRSANSLDIAEDTTASRQVAALSHPGLLLLRRPYDDKGKRFAASIPIDEVRRLRSFLGHRSADASWRVVIVDEANELNVNAANALLKSLEEPPGRTIFLLVSSAPGRLLPTIRSRCRVLSLQPLAGDDLRRAAAQALQAASKEVPGDADWPALERLAEGSAGRLLGLWDAGGLDLNARIDALLASLPKIDWRGVHMLSDELQPVAAQPRFELFFELLLNAVARLVRAQATGEGTAQEKELAARLIGPGRLATFAALWERVGRERGEAMALNLDRKTLIIQTVAALAEAAQEKAPA
jgi:DNA polymerase-3 subunit delta'